MNMLSRAAVRLLALLACASAAAQPVLAQARIVTPDPGTVGLPGPYAFTGSEWMNFRQGREGVTAPIATVIAQLGQATSASLLYAPAPQYLTTSHAGLIASRGMMPNGVAAAGSTTSNARSFHIARDNITSMQLVFPNFYVPSVVGNSPETGPGAAVTISASIEYPIGNATRTQVKFSGAATGTIADGGMLTSDALTIAIPNGAPFRVWTWRSSTQPLVYTAGNVASQLGEGGRYNGTETDQTMSGTPFLNSFAADYGPIAIIGQTTRRSVAVLGDSIDFGYLDQPDDVSGETGLAGRGFGHLPVAYTKMAAPSDSAAQFVASHANRLAIAAYATDAFVGYGTNDLNGMARTPTQLNADMATIAGYANITGKPFITRTITPISTSTDNWATTTNQTAAAAASNIASVNSTREAAGGIYSLVIDVEPLVSSVKRSGLWAVDPANIAYWFARDGVHPSVRGYQRVGNSQLWRLP